MSDKRNKSDITIPKGETVWITYKNDKGKTTHIVTSKTTEANISGRTYFLYKVEGSKLSKISKGTNPLEFYERIE